MSRPFTRERLDFLLTWDKIGLLRHDVDCCPAAARVLMQHEYLRDVRATYYVRHDGGDYSLAEAADLDVGVDRFYHRLGLHIEWEHVARVASYLGRQLPISVHNPPLEALWIDVPGVTDYAYAPEWEGRYYSDSRGSFRFGDPEDHEGPWPIQLSLHPDRWMGALLGDDHPLAVDALRRAKIVEEESAR